MNLFAEPVTGYTDWRLPENRIEAFRRVTYQRMVEGDLDHWHTGLVIASEMNLTNDQKALYCLLFGQSYRNHWAMIVLQQFPDLLNTPDEEIRNWHDKNWKRCFYAKDTKWGVRKFPDFVKSIRETIGDETPYEWIKRVSSVGTTSENFYSLNAALRSLYGIGRMTAWLAQQTIYEFFDFDIDHWDLQLYDDTWSQYDSMCYLFDRLDIAGAQLVSGEIIKYKPKKEDIELMEHNFIELMTYLNDNIPFKVDVYNVESCLCEYRKTAYGPRKIKEFTFWTSSELVDQYDDLSSAWPEIDWNPYLIGIMTKGRNVTKFSLNYEYFRVMFDHGLNLNTHYLFDDEPDAHELLSLERKMTPGMVKATNDWLEKFDEETRNVYQKRYDPYNYLRIDWSHSQIDEPVVNNYWKKSEK